MIIEGFNFSDEYEKKSNQTLNIALDTVPFYKSWNTYDPGRDKSSAVRYSAMPELTKADMRACFPNGLVSGGRNIKDAIAKDEIEYTFTSGTTGEKVVNLWNQTWWHNGELCSWKLNKNMKDLTYPQRQATLTSALNIGIHCEEDLPMDHRIMGSTLYLNEKINALCITDRHYKRMAEELKIFKPSILEANPSLLAQLAFFAIDNDVDMYSPSVIVLTYELPSKLHLGAISKVFHCPIVSSYGTTETGFVLMSCEDGMFHQNTQCCHIDFEPVYSLSNEHNYGRILVTNFDNPWSVIVRFDTGDIVKLAENSQCSCKRNDGFLFSSIEGRAANTTFSTSGKPVTTVMLDNALSNLSSIRDYNLTQTSKNEYELLYVSRSDINITERKLKEILGEIYDGGIFKIISVPDLLPGPSGKYRRTSALIPFDERTLKLI